MPGYYTFDVSLRGIAPRIWRRFVIADTAMFIDLHEAIQDAMGWYNSHLFSFRGAREQVIAELPGDEGDETGPNAFKEPIAKYFGKKKGKSCVYVYDFGDHWVHDLKVRLYDPDWPEFFGRQFLEGDRACPPEDCGGIGGYDECVEVATGRRKDRERLEWLGGWIPEKKDFHDIERLFYQSDLFLRGHYEDL